MSRSRRAGEISHDRPLTVALFVISTVAAGSMFPYFALTYLGIPPEPVAGVSAIVVTELLWRDRVRPRLYWNRAGVQVVSPFGQRSIRWVDVDRVDAVFNELHFQCGHERVLFEYDANVLASWFSAGYRERNEQRVNALVAARLEADGSGEPPRDVPRRPLLGYLLCTVVAVVEAHLVL